MQYDHRDPVGLLLSNLDKTFQNFVQNCSKLGLHVCGGRYDVVIIQTGFFGFMPEFLPVLKIPIMERDLTLENVPGTSLNVGPDNLATFQVDAGEPLSTSEALSFFAIGNR